MAIATRMQPKPTLANVRKSWARVPLEMTPTGSCQSSLIADQPSSSTAKMAPPTITTDSSRNTNPVVSRLRVETTVPASIVDAASLYAASQPPISSTAFSRPTFSV